MLRYPEQGPAWVAAASDERERLWRRAETLALAWALDQPAWAGAPEGAGADAWLAAWREVASRAPDEGPGSLGGLAGSIVAGWGEASAVRWRAALAEAIGNGGRSADLARLLYAGLARRVLPVVLGTAHRGPHRAAATFLVRSLGLDCPQALEDALTATDPELRARRLAEARCLPICPQAVDVLATQDPSTPARLDPARCPPASLGVRTDFARDTVALNVRGWALLRTLRTLQDSLEALRRSERVPARAAVDHGLVGGLRAALERLRLRVPFPPGLPLEAGRRLRLPRLEVSGREVSPTARLPHLYAVAHGDRLWLGAMPRATGWAGDGGRLLGTPWPGRPVTGENASAVLAAARAEGEGASSSDAVLLLVDEDSDPTWVRRVIERLRDLGLRHVRIALWDARTAVAVAVEPEAFEAARRARPSAQAPSSGTGTASGSPTGSGAP